MQMIQQAVNMRNKMLQNNPNANPQQILNQMLQRGEISQQLFENARNMLGMFGMKL